MNKQAKKLIHGYLSWLLKHEQAIRTQVDHEKLYSSRSVLHHSLYGLCSNIQSFVQARIGRVEYNFDSLNEKWEHFSGTHMYPVPSYLGSKNRYTANSTYESSNPKIMWCEGPYADARWAYIYFLHEELSKCL